MTFAELTLNAWIFRLPKNKDLLIIFLLCLFSMPLFFYNLGGYSLVDFDEAWYAEIAKNIIRDKNFLSLSFNGQPYFSHPPFGFMLITLSFLVFGISEFSARFPSAVLGTGSIIIIFLIGTKLFNRFVGLSASVMLLTSVWYVLRVRSANLDSIFLFFYLLTFYFALKVRDTKKFFYFFILSISALFLTKSLIGLTIFVPVIAVLLLDKDRIEPAAILKGSLIFMVIVLPFFILNILLGGNKFLFVFLNTGLRTQGSSLPNLIEIGKSLPALYLHYGIGEWFYPSVIAALGSLIFVFKKNFLILYIWFLTLFLGFISNNNVEIWHLIPIYPVLGLFIGAFLYYSIVSLFSIFNPLLNLKKKMLILFQQLSLSFFLIALIFLGLKQAYNFRNEVNFSTRGDSGLAYVSKIASNYGEELYLNTDSLLPSAVFYSGKNTEIVARKVESGESLKDFALSAEKPILIISEKWKMDIEKKFIWKQNLEVLAEKNEYQLVRMVPK